MRESDKQHTAQGVFVIINERGLHTRPSTEIVKCSVRFKADVKLICQKQEVCAKSLLAILMLAATKGTKITVKATGPDAQEAVDALIELAQNSFNIKY